MKINESFKFLDCKPLKCQPLEPVFKKFKTLNKKEDIKNKLDINV